MKVEDPKRNLKIFDRMIKEGITLSPREQFYYARELYYNNKYYEAISQFNHFLDTKEGWIENNIEACLNIAKCYQALDAKENILPSLFRSFQYDVPRAEICCEIGKYFVIEKQYSNAVFWYELATSCKMNEKSGAFVMVDCYHYIPYMQLCVCYDRLGRLDLAILYNEKAGAIKPNDNAYLYNKKYFESLKQ